MHLIYLDESGNTGNNLNDPQQPLFVLCAMVVDEQTWQSLESDLQLVINQTFPDGTSEGFEVHSGDLRSGHGFFQGKSVADRMHSETVGFPSRQSIGFASSIVPFKK